MGNHQLWVAEIVQDKKLDHFNKTNSFTNYAKLDSLLSGNRISASGDGSPVQLETHLPIPYLGLSDPSNGTTEDCYWAISSTAQNTSGCNIDYLSFFADIGSKLEIFPRFFMSLVFLLSPVAFYFMEWWGSDNFKSFKMQVRENV